MSLKTVEAVKNDIPVTDNKSEEGRVISFKDAIFEATDQAMARDPRVFVMGEGVDDPTGVFGTTKGLQDKYGTERVFDTPIAENSLTGFAAGAAMAGLRPILIHSRMDFMILSLDQLVNHACKWSYMFHGQVKVPLVVRTISARGWGAGAQHSQCIQGMLMSVPGLKIAAPATPYDAKGLLISSILDDSPVLFVEHRWLYKTTGRVPESLYSIPFGTGAVRRPGSDVTIVAVSYMQKEALKAAEELEAEDHISAEVIDPRTLKPLDEKIIFGSLAKTGRLIIADTGNRTGGAASEIAAVVSEKAFSLLKKPIVRIGCPDAPTPASEILEKAYYPDSGIIRREAIRLMK
jgi:pyruvate dehydrogenase E1 component beta subunit